MNSTTPPRPLAYLGKNPTSWFERCVLEPRTIHCYHTVPQTVRRHSRAIPTSVTLSPPVRRQLTHRDQRVCLSLPAPRTPRTRAAAAAGRAHVTSSAPRALRRTGAPRPLAEAPKGRWSITQLPGWCTATASTAPKAPQAMRQGHQPCGEPPTSTAGCTHRRHRRAASVRVLSSLAGSCGDPTGIGAALWVVLGRAGAVGVAAGSGGVGFG